MQVESEDAKSERVKKYLMEEMEEQSNIIIRKGTSDDIPAVFSLVEELAVYEKAEHEVVTSIDLYQKLYKESLFDFFVAEERGKVQGIALYYLTFSTWKGKMMYLEDFVVFPEERGRGIGQLLFEAVIEEAKVLECTLMKWQVLDWNVDAHRFYEKYDAILEKDWWNGKLFF